jgi:hypothetical protein
MNEEVREKDLSSEDKQCFLADIERLYLEGEANDGIATSSVRTQAVEDLGKRKELSDFLRGQVDHGQPGRIVACAGRQQQLAVRRENYLQWQIGGHIGRRFATLGAGDDRFEMFQRDRRAGRRDAPAIEERGACLLRRMVCEPVAAKEEQSYRNRGERLPHVISPKVAGTLRVPSARNIQLRAWDFMEHMAAGREAGRLSAV